MKTVADGLDLALEINEALHKNGPNLQTAFFALSLCLLLVARQMKGPLGTRTEVLDCLDDREFWLKLYEATASWKQS